MDLRITRLRWKVLYLVATTLGSFFLVRSAGAQFGFTPNSYMAPGYASEWGNVYSGAIMQVPQWGTSSVIGQPMTTTWQNFRLGAYIENIPNGVLLRQVMPGGLAESNGLKSGDIVISVGGTQVGYVYGRTIDLVTEMSRRADIYGRVPLVVFDSATRQMRSYDFATRQQSQLGSSISGSVVLDNGLFVANYGTLKVELQNLTRPFTLIAGGTDIKQIYGRGPFQYVLRFDSQFVYPTDRYRLVATLYDGSQQILGYGVQDISAPVSGVQAVYNLRLQSRQSQLPGVVNVGYAPPDLNLFYQYFRQFIGRQPSASEAQAWASQLASGTVSSNEIKAELLASPAFYDRAGNNPDLFIQRMIEQTTGQQASSSQIQAWRSRLDAYGGMRLAVAREYLATVFPGQ